MPGVVTVSGANSNFGRHWVSLQWEGAFGLTLFLHLRKVVQVSGLFSKKTQGCVGWGRLRLAMAEDSVPASPVHILWECVGSPQPFSEFISWADLFCFLLLISSWCFLNPRVCGLPHSAPWS